MVGPAIRLIPNWSWVILILVATPFADGIARASQGLPQAPLHLVARRGDLGIRAVRPGVSINNGGTIAFAATTEDGRSVVMVRRPTGELQEFAPGLSAVAGYGVQINDHDQVGYLAGPGISASDFCNWNSDPLIIRNCGDVVSASIVTYAIGLRRPGDISETSLMGSLVVDDFVGGSPSTRIGPFTALGPSFSINNAGELLFLGDTAFSFSGPLQERSYRLAFKEYRADPGSLPFIPSSVLARVLLSEPGRIALNPEIATNGSIRIFERGMAPGAVLAEAGRGFASVGQYPGISDDGRFAAFTAEVDDSESAGQPSGSGLFLSALVSNRWETVRVLGTNDLRGTNLFQRFHPYHQVCVQPLDDTTIGLCFGANLPDGRIGIFGATYDLVRKRSLSVQSLAEGGRDLVARDGGAKTALGRFISFSLHDSLNTNGVFVLQLDTTDGPAVVRGSILSPIELIDPLPKEEVVQLVDDQGLIRHASEEDMRRLRSASLREVEGLVADGVTRLLLRIETPVPGEVAFSLEDEPGWSLESQAALLSLPQQGASNIPQQQVIVRTKDRPDGPSIAYAILRAPLDFDRPTKEADRSAAARVLKLEARFLGDGSDFRLLGRADVMVRRPPVVLMHGIWSGADTWEWPLRDDGRFIVHLADYSARDDASFDKNADVAPDEIEEALTKMRSLNVAAVQVDYIGHSMGGILGRRYVATGEDSGAPGLRPYQRRENYLTGDIHKLITVGSPHMGSPLADVVLPPGADQPGSWPTPGGLILEAFGNCANCGALGNMRTFDEATLGMGPSHVPSHAIVGVGGRRFLEHLETLLSIVSGPVKVLAGASMMTLEAIVFGDEEHDIVVALRSQRGELPGANTTAFEGTLIPSELAIHRTETKDPRMSARAAELLLAPTQGPDFARDGFPAIRKPSPALAAARQHPVTEVRDDLELEIDPRSIEMAPGARVPVAYRLPPGKTAVKGVLVWPEDADLKPKAPFEFEFTAPRDRLGVVPVTGFVMDSEGVVHRSPPLEIRVVTDARLVALAGKPIRLSILHRSEQLRVSGTYTDGVERMLNAAEAGALFHSFDTRVAWVETNGVVEAKGPGTTTVLVRIGSLEARIPVTVTGDGFEDGRERPAQQLEAISLGAITDDRIGRPDQLNNEGQVLYTVRGGRGSGLWQDGTFTPLSRPPGAEWIGASILTDTGVVIGDAFIGEQRIGGPYYWWQPNNFTLMGGYVDGSRPDRGLFHPALGVDREGGLDVVWYMGGGIGGGAGGIYRMINGFVPRAPLDLKGVPEGLRLLSIDDMNRDGTILANFGTVEGGSEIVGGGTLTATYTGLVKRDGTVELLPRDLVMTRGTSINDAGWVGGQSQDPSGQQHAVLWRDGAPEVIGVRAASTLVNNLGHAAFVQAGATGDSVVVWAEGRAVRLNDLYAGEAKPLRGSGNLRGFNDRGWILCSANPENESQQWFLFKLAPRIVSEPVSRTKLAGDTVVFAVEELSFGARFQWRKDGAPLTDGGRISGSRSTSLTIERIQPSDAGQYDLVLVDAYGGARSAAATLTVLSGTCLPAMPGLVGFWTGDTGDQEALNRPSARIVRPSPTGAGIVGKAFVFGERSEGVATTLNTEMGAMPETTWEAWILPQQVSSSYDQIVMASGTRAEFSLIGSRRVDIGRGTDRIRVWSGGASPAVAARIVPGSWHHLGVVFRTNRTDLYINGVRVGTSEASGNHYPTDGRFAFGGAGTPWPGASWRGFQGSLDEVSVYDRALGEEELRTLFDLGGHGKCRPQEPPAVVEEPVEEVVLLEGEPLMIDAKVQGSPLISFRWTREGRGEVPGQTNETLRLASTTLNDAGGYELVAENALGMVTSQVARVVIRSRCETPWKLADRSGYPGSDRKLLFFDPVAGAMIQILPSGQTWRWSNSAWQPFGSFPSARQQAAVVYDEVRRVGVLFGGTSGGGPRADTWEWDSAAEGWTLAASSGPAPRSDHALAFDPKRGRVVVFGGSGFQDRNRINLDDTWVWDGVEWKEIGGEVPAALRPEARRAHAMAYDPQRECVVLFGGVGKKVLDDSWQLVGDRWERLRVARAAPARYYHSLVSLPSRGTVVMAGGVGADNARRGDTWELVGDSWVQWPIADLASEFGPPNHPAMAFDPSIDALMVVAPGVETWVWSKPAAPEILQQPESVVRFLGESVTLAGCASGQGSIAYRWMQGAMMDVAGGSYSRVHWTELRPRDAGLYSFVATNTSGSVTSTFARLTVLPCQPLPTNAVALWRGDGDATNAIGSAHGTVGGALAFGIGKVGQAFLFASDGASMTVPATPDLQLSQARAWTVEGWVFSADDSPRPIFEWNYGGEDPSAVGAHVWTAPPTAPNLAGSLYVNLRDSGRQRDAVFTGRPGVLAVGRWQHLGLVYDRPTGVATLYVDGTVVTNAAVGSFRTATDGDLVLGHRRGAGPTFHGLLDEFTLYTRALSASELKAIYRAGNAGKCDSADGRPVFYIDDVRQSGESVRIPGSGPVRIALLAPLADGNVRYTLDGSDPLTGYEYAGPIVVVDRTVIRAVTVGAGGISEEAGLTVEFESESGPMVPRIGVVSYRAGEMRIWGRAPEGAKVTLLRGSDLVVWEDIGEATVGSSGEVEFRDGQAPSKAAFYRLRVVGR